MVNLVHALDWAYPGIVIGSRDESGVECEVSNQLISYWDRPEAQPDEATVIAQYEADPTGLEADERARYEQEIQDGVPDALVKTTVKDPEVEIDIGRFVAAAADKAIELEGTSREDILAGNFDATLAPAPPSNGKGYARFTLDQKRTADGNVSIAMTLEIETEYQDDGAEARADIVQAPLGSGANALPFARDPNNPDGTESNTWRITPDWLATNFGYKWADENAECICQLRWGAGSTLVSPQMISTGLDRRQATWVRYGVASGTSAQGRRRGRSLP